VNYNSDKRQKRKIIANPF